MTRSLTFKLIAAFLGVSLLAVALVAVFSGVVATTEFNRLISRETSNNFVAFVGDYYASNGDLEGIDQALFARLEAQRDPDSTLPRLFPMTLADPRGVVLLSGDGRPSGQVIAAERLEAGTRIIVDGELIAIAVSEPRPPPRTRAQTQFLETFGQVLGLAAAGGAVIAVLLGVVLARTITRPVRELTEAAGRLAEGQLGQTVDVRSHDEVGELAGAFNRMSADLERADRTRRQMTADIAHELRNPLTVIGGYLEAMVNGDVAVTPARLKMAYAEIEHLERIVDDLRTLSLADAGALKLERRPLDAKELLERIAARFAPQASQKQIELRVEATATAMPFRADEARLTQVLDNLVRNALQHTPQGGRIRLAAGSEGGALRLSVADTGPGIKEEDLPHVFERFYRGDAARPVDNAQGEAGSSGLGLAIAKALVEAHGGRIRVESGPGRGAKVVIELGPEVGPDSQ
jgi:signal transduction histidine kinase